MYEDSGYIEYICGKLLKNNKIEPELYNQYRVKRGLRNDDGSGVMAGITNICNVHGYVMDEGEKRSIEGELIYRGYSVDSIVDSVVSDKRYGFEEIVYLLLLGELPNAEDFAKFKSLLAKKRELLLTLRRI